MHNRDSVYNGCSACDSCHGTREFLVRFSCPISVVELRPWDERCVYWCVFAEFGTSLGSYSLVPLSFFFFIILGEETSLFPATYILALLDERATTAVFSFVPGLFPLRPRTGFFSWACVVLKYSAFPSITSGSETIGYRQGWVIFKIFSKDLMEIFVAPLTPTHGSFIMDCAYKSFNQEIFAYCCQSGSKLLVMAPI